MKLLLLHVAARFYLLEPPEEGRLSFDSAMLCKSSVPLESRSFAPRSHTFNCVA